MKCLSTNYFSSLLEVCIFFKVGLKYQKDLPQSIRLMTIDELYENITHSNFQTQLVKQILIFLLSKVANLQSEKRWISGSIGLLKGLPTSLRNQLISLYYTQIALQIYACGQKQESRPQIEQWSKQWSFCSLAVETKFKILQMLVKLAYQYIEKNNSKTKKQTEDGNNDDKKTKSNWIEDVLILGQDNRLVYFYFPFIPEYVLAFGLGKWEALNKKRVNEKIMDVLAQQKNTNNLFLCQNLSTVYWKYLKDPSSIEINIRLHRIKQNLKQKIYERTRFLQFKLQEINVKYCQYLKEYDNQRWGYLRDRDNYIKRLQQATSLENLLEAFKDFFLCSSSKIYKLLSEKEEHFNESQLDQHYSSSYKYFANIHHIKVKLNHDIFLKAEQISNMIIENNYVDCFSLFQINIFLLQEAIKVLEKKQKMYLQKKRREQIQRQKEIQNQKRLQSQASNQDIQIQKGSRRILRHSSKSLESNSNSVTPSNGGMAQMELRKKKKSKKKFGVTILDSDEQEEDERYVTANSKQFQKYQYKTRSFQNK